MSKTIITGCISCPEILANCSDLLHKLLTRAYGTESQLASQGRGLQPKVNIGLIIK